MVLPCRYLVGNLGERRTWKSSPTVLPRLLSRNFFPSWSRESCDLWTWRKVDQGCRNATIVRSYKAISFLTCVHYELLGNRSCPVDPRWNDAPNRIKDFSRGGPTMWVVGRAVAGRNGLCLHYSFLRPSQRNSLICSIVNKVISVCWGAASACH